MMKFTILTPLHWCLTALALVLLACGSSQTTTQAPQEAVDSSPSPTPSPTQTPNLFDSKLFPTASCGDPFPSGLDQYPVEFYPVYVEYSDANLASLKSQYCEDSLKKYRESKDQDFVQVASFAGRDRALAFKEFLERNYSGVEIGEPTVIAEAPAPQQTEPTPTPVANRPNSTRQTSSQSTSSSSSEFDTVNSSCSSLPTRYKDLELQYCDRLTGLRGKNYSLDWYEVQDNDGIHLVPPGDEEKVPATGTQDNLSVAVRRIQGKPKRSVTIRCDDPPTEIWRIEITPTCNSSGTYMDLNAGFMYSGDLQASILLTLPGGDTLSFVPRLGSSSGSITSTGRSVTFDLAVQ